MKINTTFRVKMEPCNTESWNRGQSDYPEGIKIRLKSYLQLIPYDSFLGVRHISIKATRHQPSIWQLNHAKDQANINHSSCIRTNITGMLFSSGRWFIHVWSFAFRLTFILCVFTGKLDVTYDTEPAEGQMYRKVGCLQRDWQGQQRK